MANVIKVFDANEMKRRLNSHIASAIYKGVDNISTGKDSSSAFEFMRGYERGAIDTANVALGQRLADAVEVVHGRWEYWAGGLPRCPVCGYEYTDYLECKNYCGNCGAKMDGGNEDGK